MTSYDTAFVYRERRAYVRLSRAFDLVLGTLLGVLFAPIVALAMLAIYLEDGGPVVFRQRRIGRFGVPFTIVKLRTMYRADCVDRMKPRHGADPRITRVGRWVRKFSIDEMPQIINVFRGEMSLVGPRPEMPIVVQRYERWQHLRHLAFPGITCIWQTTGRALYSLEHPEATKLDLQYISRASIGTDTRILAQTVTSVLTTRGAV